MGKMDNYFRKIELGEKKLKKEISNLKKILKGKFQKKETRDLIHRLNKEKGDMEAENEQLETDIQECHSRLLEMSKNIKSAERVIESFSKESEEKDQIISEIEGERAQLQEENSENLMIIEKLKNEIFELENENSKLRFENEEEVIDETFGENNQELKEDEIKNSLLEKLKKSQNRIMDMERMVLKERESRIELEQKASEFKEIEKQNREFLKKIRVLEKKVKFHLRNNSISTHRKHSSMSLQPSNSFKTGKNKNLQEYSNSTFGEKQNKNEKQIQTTEVKKLIFENSEKKRKNREMLRAEDGIRGIFEGCVGKGLETLDVTKDELSFRRKIDYLNNPKIFTLNAGIITDMMNSINLESRQSKKRFL